MWLKKGFVMLCTTQTHIPRHAPVEKFVLLRGKVLFGKGLSDIQRLQDSISQYGLLSPIIAVKQAGKLVVLDGRKRLAALKRLAFEGKLPRSLTQIPYLLVNEMKSKQSTAPAIMANPDLYQKIVAQRESEQSMEDIADQFQLSRQCVRDILALSRLAPTIREAFFSKVIHFDQALAYAALPSHAAQIGQLKRLGPFASAEAILEQRKTPQKSISFALAA